jgi:predicted O-methyltransferase YrrM
MKHLPLTTALYQYLLDKSLREHPVLKALREETASLDLAIMQIPADQAQFFQFLLGMLGAKKVLELGTFTGYSALAMALCLPDDGQVITCDVSKNWTDRAHPFWRAAKQEHKIQLRLAPALDSLNQLMDEGFAQQFDFIFIDADKTNYLHYYEMALKLIKPTGVIAIDNVFWEGAVLDPDDTSGQTREIRKLNDFIAQDQRVRVSLLPIADGLFLVQPVA